MASHVRDAELFTVGTDDVVVTFTTDDDGAVTTTVGEREVATTGPHHYAAIAGLEPSTPYRLHVEGVAADELLPETLTTLPRPSGRRSATFATVNDVHFGETACGLLGAAEEIGPVFRGGEGEQPYPEVMNRGVVGGMGAAYPDAV